MENLNYYPLRVGKYSSVIVSDTFPNERAIRYKKSEMDSEWEHYGGFIIAESVPPEMAQKLVDAYNEKYAPKDFLGHPSPDDQIGRKTICTQPDCDCVEQAEKKAGGPVKRYECLARPGFEYIHSFTEGMEMDSISNDKSVFEPNKPTIDYISQSERDELVKEVYHKMSGKVPGCIYIAHAIIFAIESIDHLKRKHGR